MPNLKDEVDRLGGRTRPRPEKGPFKHLRDTGEITTFEAGNRTRHLSTGMTDVTLGTVLAFAETCIHEDGSEGNNTAGRRAGIGTSRELERLRERQYRRMKGACYMVARQLLGLERNSGHPTQLQEALHRIKGKDLAWDPKGGPGGSGDWTNALRLVSKATGGNHDYIGAMRSLLDLAATHCLLPRTPRHDPDYMAVRAEWAEVFNTWRSHLTGKVDRVVNGILGLLQGCHMVGADPREPLDQLGWHAVIHALEQSFRGGSTDSRTTGAVRAAYRCLRAGGLITGPDWDGRAFQRERGTTLVTGTQINVIAAFYGSDGDQEAITGQVKAQKAGRTPEPWPGCEGLPGLVEGPFGFRAALTCFTAPQDVLKSLGIPSRSVYPREQIRSVGSRTRRGWRIGTCEKNLGNLMFYAGWLHEARGVDWSEEGADLRCLLSEEHLMAFWDAVRVHKVTTDRRLAAIAGTLSRLASPFGETVADQMGDGAQADAFARVSAMLSSDSGVDGYPSWTSILKESVADSEKTAKRRARSIEAAWTRGSHDFAHDAKTHVLATQIQRIEQLCGASLDDQIRMVRSGHRFGRGWARSVLAALLWADQLEVPNRTSTLRKVDESERLHDSSFDWIRACIDGSKIKRAEPEPFEPNYRRDPDSEYPAELYQLYVMPGGAREILRTDRKGALHPISAFYAPDVYRTASERLTSKNMVALIRRGLRSALRFDPDCLDGLRYEDLVSTLTPHTFRHAYGTLMVHLGLIEIAARYLHHSSLDMLRRIYSAQTEQDYDPGAARARLRRR